MHSIADGRNGSASWQSCHDFCFKNKKQVFLCVIAQHSYISFAEFAIPLFRCTSTPDMLLLLPLWILQRSKTKKNVTWQNLSCWHDNYYDDYTKLDILHAYLQTKIWQKCPQFVIPVMEWFMVGLFQFIFTKQ